MTQSMSPGGWVTVGHVRVTASEWALLHMLVTNPSLQEASNAELEQRRESQFHSTVATDIVELINKGLLAIHSSTREKRRISPTEAALEAMAGSEHGL